MTADRRRFLVWLGLIAVAGLAWRLVYAYAIVGRDPLLGDALEFHLQANLLADGRGYIDPFLWVGSHIARPSADKPPLYPTVEGFVSLLGGRSWQWHHLVGIASGTATIVVVGLLGRRVAGPRTGLLAAAIAAAYPLLVAADGALRSEATYALLVTLALLLALRVRERPTLRNAALLGAVVGLAALTRGEAVLLVLLVVLPVTAWRTRWTAVALVTCGVVLAPWLIRCWTAFDQPVVISTNTGGLIAGANCATTYSGPLMGQWDFGCIPHPVHDNQAQEADRLRRRGVDYARDHSGRVPAVVAARVGRSFELFHPRRQIDEERFFEGRDATVEKVGVAMYYALVVLAALGFVALRRRRDPATWLLCAPIVLVVVVSITAYGFTRFRVGAEPAIVVLAAVGIESVRARVAARRRRSAPPPAAAPAA